AAIDFLRHHYGPSDALWCLTAIEPDTGAIETRTFTAEGADTAAAWIDRWQGRRNLYFSVNAVRGMLTKKAEKTDICRQLAVHVDADPDPTKPVGGEQARILAE